MQVNGFCENNSSSVFVKAAALRDRKMINGKFDGDVVLVDFFDFVFFREADLYGIIGEINTSSRLQIYWWSCLRICLG